jgi:hypothetical protein
MLRIKGNSTVSGHDRYRSVALALVLSGGLFACEEPPKAEAEKPAEPALSAAQAAMPAPTPAAEAEPEKPSRPANIEQELTPERRAAVEKAHSQAKGFLVAKDVEKKLKDNKAVKEEKKAVETFDGMAKGKWVLFTGTMVNLTEKGFDMAVVYTPQLPNDPMGMSRQFFTVSFSDVEGYDQSKFKVGNVGVVLAKYNGKQAASPAHELVEAGHWQ